MDVLQHVRAPRMQLFSPAGGSYGKASAEGAGGI
jgi:hypothetical protein